MADKTWTATDLELGKLTIIRTRTGQDLHLERRYRFLDAEDAVLTQIAGGRVSETVAIVDLPADILDALQKIDAWTKQKALEQEGMAE